MTFLPAPSPGEMPSATHDPAVARSSFAANTVELMATYLDPAVWSRGIGTALWAEAQQAMTVEGYRHVSARALDGNERARRFYLKHDFTAQATSQGIIEENSAALPLTRVDVMLKP